MGASQSTWADPMKAGVGWKSVVVKHHLSYCETVFVRRTTFVTYIVRTFICEVSRATIILAVLGSLCAPPAAVFILLKLGK